MEKTYLYAYIEFDGNDDFPLNIFTQEIGVQPTKTWKIGERVKPGHPTNKRIQVNTCWRFEIETIESLDTEDVLRPLLEVFQSKTDTINQLKEQFSLDVRLELVMHIYDGHTPGLVIYPPFSKFAAEINAFLDVDMYVFPFTEPKE
ncbi:DUF4279 domain-containing protein [Solibacillus silvestris]|uniref:DUF4279 domain-containing protein n=1 Tax=Solibacillus silvestris TaxID=76853 RepID=UPI003F7F73AB